MKHKSVAIGLFVLLMVAYAYVNQGSAANQNARFFMLQSMRYHRTFAIDPYHSKTIDKALYENHYYSAQAPGTALVALPAFIVASELFDLFLVPRDVPVRLFAVHWMTCIGSVGLFAAAGGALLFLLLSQWMALRYALVAILGFFLGSLPFPYATQLFSHSVVIGCFATVLWLLFAKSAACISPLKRSAVAGLLCGIAVACEFPAAIAAGGIFFFLLFLHPRQAMPFALAGAIPCLLVGLHNGVIYGSPFVTGYAYAVLHNGPYDGVFRFPPPLIEAWTLLGSPFRGLFFWSPIFLLIFPGFVFLWKESRPLFWLLLIPSVLHIVFIMSFVAPHGGYALGPRYLAPILPFLMIAAARGFAYLPRVGVLLAIFSIVLHGMATLLWAGPPTKYLNPLAELYIPMLLRGKVMAPNAGMLVGLSGLWSFLPVILWVLVVSLVLFWALPKEGHTTPPYNPY